MNRNALILLLSTLSAVLAHGQGTFFYDQQSSTDEVTLAGGPVIQQLAPYGQSFTPSLSVVGFIRLTLYDNDPNNGLGATLLLRLRANSISGPILDSSSAVVLTNGFIGRVNFFFGSGVPVNAGDTYVFETVVQSGDLWKITAGEYNYPGGTVFANGLPVGGMSDVWFREGIVVPEPCSGFLLALGGALALWSHSRRSKD